MKSASTSALKWQQNSGGKGVALLEGVKNSDKDQAAAAIAAKQIYQQALQESFTKDAFAKGLQKSGKAGHLRGVEEKGVANYDTGILAESSKTSYATESGKYDSARGAAKGMIRGGKGSAVNMQRVTAVVTALRAVKIGK